MRIFDTHCDTITCIYEQNKSINSNDLHIDIKKMKQYKGFAQFFAVFSDPTYHSCALERTLEIIDKLYTEIDENSLDICFCGSTVDADEAYAQNKIAAFLSLEGAESVTDLSILKIFHRLGIRCIAPTWNCSNHIATSVTEKNPQYGLTEFGVKLIKEMNKLKIAVDVSHISEKAFWDIAEISSQPFIASHSNSKSVCGHIRNLTDVQFKALVNARGCVGINLYPLFLSDNKSAGIADIIKHIEYFMSLGGENNIGIGADFDGVDSLPDAINDAADLYKIFNEMSKMGYSNELIEKISWGNFYRTMNEIIG